MFVSSLSVSDKYGGFNMSFNKIILFKVANICCFGEQIKSTSKKQTRESKGAGAVWPSRPYIWKCHTRTHYSVQATYGNNKDFYRTQAFRSCRVSPPYTTEQDDPTRWHTGRLILLGLLSCSGSEEAAAASSGDDEVNAEETTANSYLCTPRALP